MTPCGIGQLLNDGVRRALMLTQINSAVSTSIYFVQNVISSVCFDVTLTRGLLVVGTELLCPPPNLERIDARFSPSAYLIP